MAAEANMSRVVGERFGPSGRRRVVVELTPQVVELVAARTVELLLLAREREPELLSAGELARYLRVERPWVYKNRHLLGGQRIGDGPKAPWRFDLQTAFRALEQGRAGKSMGSGA